MDTIIISERITLTWYISAVQKQNAAVLLRKPGRLASQYACRHTYCTNMALAGMNPKTLQYLMGHSEIGVTLDVYTHVSF